MRSSMLENLAPVDVVAPRPTGEAGPDVRSVRADPEEIGDHGRRHLRCELGEGCHPVFAGVNAEAPKAAADGGLRERPARVRAGNNEGRAVARRWLGAGGRSSRRT